MDAADCFIHICGDLVHADKQDDMLRSVNQCSNTIAVSIDIDTLAIYGILYIIVEYARRGKAERVSDVHDISYVKAFGMGCFQVLALIPGTSRSGSTILGGLMLGLSRSAAAEMSFFLALPTMLGASALKAL